MKTSNHPLNSGGNEWDRHPHLLKQEPDDEPLWTETCMNERVLTSGSGTWESTAEMQKESRAAPKPSNAGWGEEHEEGRSPTAILSPLLSPCRLQLPAPSLLSSA